MLHTPIKEVLIINCGLGNLFNLSSAIAHLGVKPLLSNDPEAVVKAQAVILPGVGSFNTGMERLQQAGLDEAIKAYVKKGSPLLGICLGMQLLFDSSEENGYRKGLQILSGEIKRLESKGKIPQINWNFLEKPADTINWEQGILRGIKRPCMYFIHSYGVRINHTPHAVAQTTYGGYTFCSVANDNHIWGCQFHPEISGKQGLKMLENFLIGGGE